MNKVPLPLRVGLGGVGALFNKRGDEPHMRDMVTAKRHRMAARTRRALGLFVLVGLTVLPHPAMADFAGIGVFGGGGVGDGELTRPMHVAVEDGTGDVFVADSGNHRVQVFAPTSSAAEYLTQFGGTDLGEPVGIAVDVTGGQTVVYVSDAAISKIVKFTSDGSAIPTFTVDSSFVSPARSADPTDPHAGEIGSFRAPLAVDPATHDLLVADPGANRVSRYTPTGGYVASLNGSSAPDGEFTGLLDIDATPTGDVVVVDSATGSIGDVVNGGATRVLRFGADGGYQQALGPITGGAGAVAVDPDSGHVVVAGNLASWNNNQPLTVNVFGVDGTALSSSALSSAAAWSQVPGMAFDPGSSHRLYAVTDVDPFGQNYGLVSVQVLADVTPPVATITPATDVAAFSATLNGTVNPQGSDATYHFEYSPDGLTWTSTPDENAGSGTTETPVHASPSGLADNTEYHVRLFVAIAAGAITRTSDEETFTTLDADPPVVTMDPPSAVTSDGAALSGTVDAQGYATTWRFQYATADGEWTDVPDPGTANGAGAQPVTGAVTGLDPLTDYRIRLIATNGAGTAESSEATITTAAAPPSVTTEAAASTGSSTAKLTGAVNPHKTSTTYWFEYGTTTSYDTSVPATQDAAAGAGATAVSVTHSIGGLKPGTIYHVRLVARNAVGTTGSADRTFTTRSVAPAPDARSGRGYEMVSPEDKNSADVTAGSLYMVAAQSGSTAAFHSSGSFPDAQQSLNDAMYLSTRTAEGWRARSVLPPQSKTVAFAPQTALQGFSSDLSRMAIRAGDPPLTPDTQPLISNLFVRNNDDNTYKLVTPAGPPDTDWPTLNGYAPAFVGASADFNHVLFESEYPMTSDSPPTPAPWSDGEGNNLYEWVDGVGARLVTVLPGETPAPSGGFAGTSMFTDIYGTGRNSANIAPNAISRDGRHIFFGDTASRQLYVRIDGQSTLRVSASQRSTPEASQPVSFQNATPDGDKVYFTSCEKLTDDSIAESPSGGCSGSGASDLYVYDVSSRELSDLSVLTGGGQDAQRVEGVIGVSDSGDHVYFATVAGSIFVAHDGKLDLVAQTDVASDRKNWDTNTIHGVGPRPSRVTADGRYLLLVTQTSLTDYDADGHRQMYRYDAMTDETTCVSCNPRAERSAADASFQQDEIGIERLRHQPQGMSRDGSRVYFHTAEALTAGDTNGVSDVYEWENGTITLISDGTGANPAYFSGASETGDDVFFTTASRLVGWDRDGNVDLYDARKGGGFPEPKASSPCADDACQGPPSSPAAPTAAASVTFSGSGNANLGRAPARSPKAMVTKPRAITGSTAALKVKVPAKGELSWAGTGLRKARRRVSKAATYTIRVTLTAAAKKTLIKRKSVKAKARIAFKPDGGSSSTVTVSLTFKVASAKNGR